MIPRDALYPLACGHVLDVAQARASGLHWYSAVPDGWMWCPWHHDHAERFAIVVLEPA